MQTRILIAATLWWVTCASDGLSAATLYPIVSSESQVSSQRAASAEIAPTNQTAEVSSTSVTLKPTFIAAAGSGGVVELKGRALSLRVHHLDPGRYELQVIKKSSGRLETLGTLTIVDPTLGPDRQANDNKKEASANPESVSLQTDAQMNLASAVLPGDIARVQLVGAGGNAILVGELK